MVKKKKKLILEESLASQKNVNPWMFRNLLSNYQASKCGFVMLLVAVFWMTEVTHLAITSMLPVVLLPLVGILTTNEVASTYMNSTNMIFWGGITMALAVEHSRLHERIALFVILKIGEGHVTFESKIILISKNL